MEGKITIQIPFEVRDFIKDQAICRADHHQHLPQYAGRTYDSIVENHYEGMLGEWVYAKAIGKDPNFEFLESANDGGRDFENGTDVKSCGYGCPDGFKRLLIVGKKAAIYGSAKRWVGVSINTGGTEGTIMGFISKERLLKDYNPIKQPGMDKELFNVFHSCLTSPKHDKEILEQYR